MLTTAWESGWGVTILASSSGADAASGAGAARAKTAPRMVLVRMVLKKCIFAVVWCERNLDLDD